MRDIDIVVVSDIHLGTFGSHAKELLKYLRSINTETLILNGDIIDFWQLKKKFFPADHIEVINQILKMAINGTMVYYITGNHDDVLRRMSEFSMGNLHLRDKLILQVKGKSHWIFHGDAFDSSITITPFLAKLGGKSYDMLILLNRWLNRWRQKVGKENLSFSKKIKASVKRAVKFISDFEETAINHAIKQGYDYVLCGHIHQPQIRKVSNDKGEVIYLNSGDWVENLTALEYSNEEWTIYKYDESHYSKHSSQDLPDLDLIEGKAKKKLSIQDLHNQAKMIVL